MGLAAAARIGDGEGKIANGVDALAIFRLQSHDDGEVLVAPGFVKIASRLAADARLDRGVDVAGRPGRSGQLARSRSISMVSVSCPSASKIARSVMPRTVHIAALILVAMSSSVADRRQTLSPSSRL